MPTIDTTETGRDQATTATGAASASRRPSRAPFSESHRRMIAAPVNEVWPACLQVTAADIRAFGPLMTLRGLPARLRGGHGVGTSSAERPLLQLFADEGFVQLVHHDTGPTRRVEFGAIGRFWSLTDNAPRRFESADDLLRFDEPGFARVWFELTAAEEDGGTLVSTTTIVDGTDRRAERRFAPYWAIIRLPSGLIRRSWLAAIERRVLR